MRARAGTPSGILLGAAAALILAPPGAARAQARSVDVTAYFSEETVLVGATVEYVIDVEGEGRASFDISPAAMPNGLVVTGQSQSSSLDIRMPGGVTRVQRLTLSVLARAPGEYRVPGPGVLAAGTLVRGDDATLTVVGGPADASAAPAAGTDDIAVRARLARDTVYVGEPVELTTEVLLSDAARRRLRGAPQYFPPTPPGFLIHDLGGGARRFATAGDGRRFEVQRFRRAFVPLEPGSFELPPARVELDLRRSLFDPSMPNVVESERPRLVVLPLPPAGRPDGFQGAVGRYAVDVSLDPRTTTTGDAVRLEVTVRGRGYVKPLPAPSISAGEGIEVVSPMEEADIRSMSDGLGGEKRFSWILVPDRPGVFELPEVRYPYFDPDTRRYAIARGAPLRLEVRGAPDGPAAETAALAAPRPRAGPGGATAWVRSGLFRAAQGAPLVAFALAFLALGGGRRRRVTRAELAERTETLLGHWAYADAQGRNASLRQWLADRLERPDLLGAQAEEVVDAVSAAGVPTALGRVLGELLASLDATRYGRAGGRALDGDAGRALIRALHADLPRPPVTRTDVERGRARLRTAASLVLLAGVALAAAAAMTGRPVQPSAAFAAGLEALNGGEAPAAAAAFSTYLRERPDDAAGWYNLGLAEAAGGSSGRAIWAWLNALRRAPDDGLAAANARALGAQEAAIDRAKGRPPVSRAALALLATLALYVVAIAVLRSGASGAARPWRVLAGVAAFCLVALAGAATLRDRTSPLAVPLQTVALRYEPVRAGEVGQSLPPGTALVPRERRDGWVRVRLPSPGSNPLREGWVAASQIARVTSLTLP